MQLYKKIEFQGENLNELKFHSETHFVPEDLTDEQLDIALKIWLGLHRLTTGAWEIK